MGGDNRSGPVLVAGKTKAPTFLTYGGMVLQAQFWLFNGGGAVGKIWFPSPDPLPSGSLSLNRFD
jgi:hypothetical protein